MLGPLPDDLDVACLLITGTAGAGKSAIAKCETDPPVPGRFESALLLANLAAIWPNHR